MDMTFFVQHGCLTDAMWLALGADQNCMFFIDGKVIFIGGNFPMVWFVVTSFLQTENCL